MFIMYKKNCWQTAKYQVYITADKPQTPKYEKDQNIDHELEQTEYLYFNIYTNFVGVLYSTVTPV